MIDGERKHWRSARGVVHHAVYFHGSKTYPDGWVRGCGAGVPGDEQGEVVEATVPLTCKRCQTFERRNSDLYPPLK